MSSRAALTLQVLDHEPAEPSGSAGLPASGEVLRLVARLSLPQAPLSVFPAGLRAPVAVAEAGGTGPAPTTVAVDVAPVAVVEVAPVAVEVAPVAVEVAPVAVVAAGGTGPAPATVRLSVRTLVRSGLTVATVAAAAALLFLSIGPMLLPFQVFSVLSGSMAPGIPTGSMVVVTRAPAEELKVGDVITFTPPGRDTFVSHRIFSMEATSAGPLVSTKGDANPAADPWKLTLQGSGWRYLFSVPYLGYAVVFAKSGLGRLALVVLPGIGLGLLYLIDELLPRRRRDA